MTNGGQYTVGWARFLTVNYTYSNASDLTQLIAGNVTQTYAYNSNHQVTAESLSIDGKTFYLGYEYDNLGGLTALKSPNAETLNFTANAFGQPSEANIVNGQTHVSAAKYDPNGILNSSPSATKTTTSPTAR